MQKNRNRIINVGLFAGSIVALAGFALQAEDGAGEGVVRISDVSGYEYSTGHVPAHSAVTFVESFDHTAGGVCDCEASAGCRTGRCPVLSRRRSRGIFGCKPFACLNRMLKRSWDHDLACKRCLFGYLIPSGCCGKGCVPLGHYGMIYAGDPNYLDRRDGSIYSAAGYGAPLAVPLAPNVSHTYNYGWGLPMSRLTPISTVSHK